MDKIYEMIQETVEEKVEQEVAHIQKENAKLKEEKQKLQENYQGAIEKIQRLEAEGKKNEDTSILYDILGKGDPEKLEILLAASSLRRDEIQWRGMDTERIPHWFKILCEYYQDKETAFHLMDVFEISYPFWAKNFKMPYDYNEEELTLFIKNCHLHYITNSEIFSQNTGFFWNAVSIKKGNSYELVNNQTNIPWQFLLRNPLFQNESIFELVLEQIQKGASHAEYFSSLPKFQSMSEKDIARLGEALIQAKGIHSSYKNEFIKEHEFLLKQERFAKNLENKMDASRYSSYHFVKFPEEMQKEFILHSENKTLIEKLELIQTSTLNQKEKKELAMILIDKETL